VPIRVAHILSHDLGIPPTLPFCRPLVARGWDVAIFCPDGPRVADARAAGLLHIPLALERRIHPLSDARGSWQLARDLRRHRFDLVHTHNIKTGLIGRVVAAAVRARVIVHTLHGLAYSQETPALRRRGHALLERIANRSVDMVFSQSEEDLETLVATGGIDPSRIMWIGNGIDLARFDPATVGADERAAARAELGIGEDDVLFLSAGRLVREKGFAELFEAAEAARRSDPRVRLAIAGPVDAAKADALDPAALRRAEEAGILLLGERKDMPRLYAAADVVTLASWREGMPRVLMEGAAMGKALLASNARGCREVVRADQTGLLVPTRDAPAFTRAMLTLTSDQPLRARLATAARPDALSRFNLHHSIARVLSIYDSLLGTGSPPPTP
jgi:glycosyltransferase involved in cell wall biosynthesis